MIVKNEAPIIARCLRSVIPHIDYWVICDNGSTDGTQDVIRETMVSLPGYVLDVPWVDFGHNRTEAMDEARSRFPDADYILMIDADNTLNVRPGFDWGTLTADSYDLRHEAAIDYCSTLIFSTRKPWGWTGAVHEHAICDEPFTLERLEGVTLIDLGDGSNQRDDLAILLPEHARDPENERTVFYIAQTHLGLHHYEEALTFYTLRESMEGGYDEERWYAAMMVGRLRQHLNHDSWSVRQAYLRAYFLRPHRYEPLCWLAQYCRLQSDYESAFTFSSLVWADLRYPSSDGVLIDRNVYDFLMLFEFGISAAMTGRIHIARLAAYRLRLIGPRVPEENKAALASAIEWAALQGAA